jgi:menaquinone-dependent protoporphyrinogen IX oxidase
MKGLIVYQSDHGSTANYAQWIAEDTGYALREVKKFKKKELEEAQQVVIGCPIHAGKPQLLGWIKKHWALLMTKDPILFTTSAAPADSPQVQDWFHDNTPEFIRRGIQYFPQGGRFVVRELGGLTRLFLKIAQMFESDPEVKSRMLDDVDNVDRAGLAALLKAVSSK